MRPRIAWLVSLLLFAVTLPAQVVRLRNHGEFPFVGWIRTTVDQPIAEAGVAKDEVGAVEWVRGRRVGIDAWAVDLQVKLPAHSARTVDLKSGATHAPVPAPLPADLVAHFGGPITIGGVSPDLLSLERDGAGLLGHLRARTGRMLVTDLWLWWYPGQGWARGESLTMASDCTVDLATEKVTGLQLRFGDGIVLPVGAAPGAPLIDDDVVLADGQGRIAPLLIVWPRLLASGSDWSSVGAERDELLGAVGISHVYPQGVPVLPAAFDAMAWAKANYDKAKRALRTWDWAVIGPNARSGDTGAQEEQTFVRSEPLQLPGAEHIVYWSACKMAERPCHYREHSGDIVVAANHPDLRLWDGRVHWHPGVSPDRLGKTVWPSDADLHGRLGPDVEHWLLFTLAAAHRYTASPALDWLLRHQAAIYPLQWTVQPGLSTSQPYAARAIGWECAASVMMAQELEDRGIAGAVRDHCKQRMTAITLPALRERGDYWDVRWDDPRLGAGAWWIPWQQSVGAYWLDVAGELFAMPDAREVALRGAMAVMRDAWRKDGNGGWISSPTCAVGRADCAADYVFDYFGMSLAPAAVLRASKDDRSLQLWHWLCAGATQVDQTRWLAPELAVKTGAAPAAMRMVESTLPRHWTGEVDADGVPVRVR